MQKGDHIFEKISIYSGNYDVVQELFSLELVSDCTWWQCGQTESS